MSSAEGRYNVTISERAAEMLLQHIRFLAQVSRHSADRLRTAVTEAAKSLETFPLRGYWLTDPLLPSHKYRKLLVENRYMLIYQIREDRVFIDYIVDCRQDYQWLI